LPFFFSSRRRHTRFSRDWSSDVCSSDLFARNLFIQPTPEELQGFEPRFTVIQVPGFTAVPEVDGTRSGVFVVLNFTRRLVLIGRSEERRVGKECRSRWSPQRSRGQDGAT